MLTIELTNIEVFITYFIILDKYDFLMKKTTTPHCINKSHVELYICLYSYPILYVRIVYIHINVIKDHLSIAEKENSHKRKFE